ncbi:MAG: DUF4254 domain-containing protein [Humidesulfovibrio sp.]|jgi:hypothetical protein|uniref:DUF4254 domain-containing protein n=1 Tax=Humidesulfovibrio sp. TaxID=2910988 RepID=UPI002733F870|nr:DUF4254 domain-containing protein [Humidesulfovibrio sp.]MDP2847358.1 DUF4254 domain-containing protein [Humidesulfovibrio sp.]
MSNLSFDDIRSLLRQAFEAQDSTVADWHRQEPVFSTEVPDATDAAGFLDLLSRQHWCNFRLWHVEDRARRKDAGAELIADCKYAIDKLNQQRNDLIERMDLFLVRAFDPIVPSAPQGARARFNTETIGVALDRGSILALKKYHMQEQAERAGVTADFVSECSRKYAVLAEQRADLCESVIDLVDDYSVGLKRPKVYYQFKMYNDPRLNPELYTRKAGA